MHDQAIASLLKQRFPSIQEIEQMLEAPVAHTSVAEVPFGQACNDVGLDPSKVCLDASFDFSSNKSIFDRHTLQTLGCAVHSGESFFDASHTVRIDRSVQGVEAQHTLYHELAHCVVYERRLYLDKMSLDRAWNEAFAELVAFSAVLLRNGSNLHSVGLWARYRRFLADGGSPAAVSTYRNDRAVSSSEEHDLWYSRLRWVLFEAIAGHEQNLVISHEGELPSQSFDLV